MLPLKSKKKKKNNNNIVKKVHYNIYLKSKQLKKI